MRLRVHTPDGVFDWESNSERFRVGRGDSCALRIEGAAAKFASWEHAEFCQQEDGNAYVVDLTSSNGTYLDGAKIEAAMPVRVGSVVQLGRAGARLEVLELKHVGPAVSPEIITAPAGRPSADRQPRASSKSLPPQSLLIGGAVVVVLAIMAFFVFRGTGSAPPDDGPALARQTAPEQSGASRSVEPQTEAQPDPRDNEPIAPATPPPASPDPPPPVAPDPWKLAKEVGLPAYRLLVVEEPKSEAAWPLAGSVVVGERALLTTASVGVELAKADKRGLRMKAVKSSSDAAGVTIDRVRLYVLFQPAKDDEQLYFDMALLTTTEPLGPAAPLASAAELAKLEHGLPLACFATDLDRFVRREPELHQAKVLTVTRFETNGPRLLHLLGGFSDSASGSPIFNDQGHLIALYCEPGDPLGGGQPVHYAKIIEPKLIESGLSDKENQIWVAPVVEATPSATQESAQ